MRDFIKKNSNLGVDKSTNIILYVITFICLVAIVFGIISLVNYNNQVKAQYDSSMVASNTDLFNPVAEDTNIYTPSPERKDRSSLTLEEIHSLPMPTSYVLQKIENYEITEEDSYSYTDNPDTELLIPEWMDIDTEEVLSSGLEGDQEEYMIYTLTRNTMVNGDVCDILYINSPVNLEFVACSVEFENVTYLYNFSY